jgi:hypothetical protein
MLHTKRRGVVFSIPVTYLRGSCSNTNGDRVDLPDQVFS